MKQWVEISEHSPLRPGDEVRLFFTVTGFTYLTAMQVALVERKLKRDPRFTMLRHSIPQKTGAIQLTELTVDVRVNKVQHGYTGDWMTTQLIVAGTITALVIAAVIKAAFVGIVAYVVFSGARKLVEATGEAAAKSTEAIQETGWTALKIAGAFVLAVIAWRYIK